MPPTREVTWLYKAQFLISTSPVNNHFSLYFFKIVCILWIFASLIEENQPPARPNSYFFWVRRDCTFSIIRISLRKTSFLKSTRSQAKASFAPPISCGEVKIAVVATVKSKAWLTVFSALSQIFCSGGRKTSHWNRLGFTYFPRYGDLVPMVFILSVNSRARSIRRRNSWGVEAQILLVEQS